MRNRPATVPSAFPKPRLLIRFSLIGIVVISSSMSSLESPAAFFAPNDLEKKLGESIRSSGAETVAVAYYDLAGGKELLINPDLSFHAASK